MPSSGILIATWVKNLSNEDPNDGNDFQYADSATDLDIQWSANANDDNLTSADTVTATVDELRRHTEVKIEADGWIMTTISPVSGRLLKISTDLFESTGGGNSGGSTETSAQLHLPDAQPDGGSIVIEFSMPDLVSGETWKLDQVNLKRFTPVLDVHGISGPNEVDLGLGGTGEFRIKRDGDNLMSGFDFAVEGRIVDTNGNPIPELVTTPPFELMDAGAMVMAQEDEYSSGWVLFQPAAEWAVNPLNQNVAFQIRLMSDPDAVWYKAGSDDWKTVPGLLLAD